MGKILEQKFTRFDKGVTNDFRDEDKRFARSIKHFDIHSEKTRLIPLRSMETDGSVGDTEKLCKVLSAYYDTGSAGKQYALGVTSGTSQPAIFERSSLPSGAWTGSLNGALGTAGARSENMFFAFNGSLFYARAGTHIGRYNLVNDTHFETTMALTYTNVGQGIVHSKDGLAYFPYYVTTSNITTPYIGKFNTSYSLSAGLTLPVENIISDICEYGNLLAIATRPKYASTGGSVVYIWDRGADSPNNIIEKIDAGAEIIHMVEEIDGELIMMSSSDISASNLVPKLIFRRYISGVGAQIFLTINVGPSTSLVSYGPSTGLHTAGLISKQKRNGRVYFAMGLEIDGIQHDGIWAIGKTEEGNLSLSMERLVNNDTAITTYLPMGFQLLGDYLTVFYKDNSVYSAKVTNNDGAFSATSIYETVIHNLGDSSVTKKLLSGTLIFEPLPASSTVTLKYKKDEETSFTKIFDYTTTSGISHTAINIESSGATLPQFKEITFRIETTGPASATQNKAPVITGLKFKAEIIDKDIN